MILTLDIGNSFAKLTLFDGQDIVHHDSVRHDQTLAALRTHMRKTPDLQALHWCSVSHDIEDLIAFFTTCPMPVRQLDPSTPPTHLRIAYRTPHTLGADRLAAVLGARTLCPQSPLLVIDAGTCITYDLLLADNTYMGGNISPGLQLRLQAMHDHTARLPLVNAEGESPNIAYDTTTALRSGVRWGIRYEIEGYIRHLREQYPDIRVFLTGGQHLDFITPTENCIFADDYLVARGLATLASKPNSPNL